MEELKKLTTRVAHVLPVSDDGGSTAEIVRVLGKIHNYTTSYFFRSYFPWFENDTAPVVGEGIEKWDAHYKIKEKIGKVMFFNRQLIIVNFCCPVQERKESDPL